MTHAATHPAYGVLRDVSPFASVLLENNPSHMTLEGTNTWLLGSGDGDGLVVVDPGYEDLDHLPLIAEAGSVELILLTHHHPDHAEGAPWLAERTSAPVRALSADLCVRSAPLRHGEIVAAGGLEIEVLHTPGHTSDSVTLTFTQAGQTHVLTGDTVLGRGTTVLDDLGDYLRTLRTLDGLPEQAIGLPGHGPELPDLASTVREYTEHREQRLDQVRAALRELGADATPRQVVEMVYADVDRSLWAPAESSVVAQLEYLRSEG
ncbi:MBL fold metallo-hydrolase [Prauserella marina]|uniref:Glyoxylase, beta-lactamase superfamily II n=1 Tax=Prauserella marina TaxID=530584 RepID=A0A222VX65_9PSEU|nr:MBL fold metallo-hydrolase [Prauserella marina]ASR38412.1 MBL fold metallo-hydrolase [Prauserella marina]PWV78355.1 glyoxylase-like metal-dependent hydrolase (beta-lactamase superfamily II) [Prauserella marina]SDC84166.1 Glyoxylase, beta-lactamase superfamily II [Prauserella marina]